jgi:hypothetical protein
VGGHANRNGRQSRRRQRGERRSFRQHDRQRPRPKAFGQACCRFREYYDDTLEHCSIEHVDDQRIEARPPLDFEDARHRLGVEGKRSQAIDSLGWESNEPPGAQHLRRTMNVCGFGRQQLHPEGMAPGSGRYL